MFKSLIPINNILLAQNGKTIARNRNLLGSSNAVCFLSQGEKSVGFRVILENPEQLPSDFQVNLTDSNGIVLCSGTTLLNNEVHLTSNYIIENNYSHSVEDFNLELTTPDGKIAASSSIKLKLYCIGMENESAVLYRKGLPMEVLDHVISISGTPENNYQIEGLKAPLVYTPEQLTYSVMTFVPPRYDVWRGAAYFGNYANRNAITLHYNAYLAANRVANSILNCYDCAAVLQYTLTYNRYPSSYCYMAPYGYMKQAYLVGRGNCNNPFYQGYAANMIVAATARNRTGFANHAFIRLTQNSAILDSCAGPHYGNEYINAYVTNAIDNQIPNPPTVATGTAANVGYYTGVTRTDVMDSIMNNKYDEFANLDIFKTNNLSSSVVHSNKIYPNLIELENLVTQNGWEKFYGETVPGTEDCQKILFFKKGDDMFFIKAFVSNGENQHAINRFFDLCFNIQSPDHQLTKVEDSPYHQHVEHKNEEYQLTVVQHYNVVMQIHTSNTNIDLKDLFGEFNGIINDSVVPFNEMQKEVKISVSLNNETEQYRIDLLDYKEEDVLEYIDTDNNLKVIEYDTHYMIFEKIEKKLCMVQVWSVNDTNLSCTSHQLVSVI